MSPLPSIRGRGNRAFIAALGLVAAVALCNLLGTRGARGAADTRHAPAAAGSTRDVDPALIRRLIQEGKLSDHEAEHYRKLGHEQPDAGAPTRAR
jgi:hypothetical protein